VSDKVRRRAAIRRILQESEVASQDELADMLAREGLATTQATLSRDLADMGVARERGPHGFRYRLDARARYMTALRQVVGMEILDVRHNGSLVVVRTLTGRAEGVAGFLDDQKHLPILGTVAGDDTVFVAPTDTSLCGDLAAAIRAFGDGGGFSDAG
jgi:transcriptional regulator of arginine metabolism